MKSRRNFVVAILLVAIMCIGVGFAALSGHINGTGSITYDPTFQIAWNSAAAESGKTTDVTDIVATGGTLTFNVNTTSWAKNDSVTIKAIVKNDLKYAAKNVEVQELNTTAVRAYYDVTVELENGTNTIAADGTLNVIITIEMTAYPQVGSGFNADFTFKVYAEQVI